MTRIGITLIGCGYVADFYAATIGNHPELEVTGVWDRDSERMKAFAERWSYSRYDSLQAVLDDPRTSIVVNLTNPASHFEISSAALRAGKHVYSEKPLAMSMSDASALLALAEERGLVLASAPCSLLGATAQTLWAALERGDIGQPRLVYAELDDGMIHRMPHTDWVSESGAVWPAADEFAVGCTLEHTGYVLSWLTAFFGPVKELSAYAAELLPAKGVAPPGEAFAPDFTCAVLRFADGPVARLTNSIVAPRDHTLTIIGDDGVLSTPDVLRYDEPVSVRRGRSHSIDEERIGYLGAAADLPLKHPEDYSFRYRDTHDMDFARGIADVARSINTDGRAYLDARHALHVLEVSLAITNAVDKPGWQPITSSFPRIRPLP